ncbi:MAG: chemotaxis protein CheW [Ghiorsea sp.]
MDEELLGEFLTESNENLESIEQQLMDLEANPKDTDLLDSIFRAIHTVKGSCGFLNLAYLEKVAHAGENLLSRIRSLKYEVNEDIVSLLLECADAIKQLLEGLESTGEEPKLDHSDLISRLEICERLVMGEDVAQTTAQSVSESSSKDEPIEEVVDAIESEPLSWLVDFEDEVIQALVKADILSAADMIEAGFAKLRGIEPLTPADALKMLGIARVQTDKQTSFVSKPDTGADKPTKAPKRKEELTAKPAEAVAEKETVVKTVEVEGQLPALQVKKAEASPAQKNKRPQSNASVRVDIGLLDELMNQVGELVLTRNSLMQMISASGSMEFMRVGRDVDQITEQLQEQLLRTRMQPIQTIWSSVPRIVRDIGKQLDKKIKVVMEGEDTELDRTILNALKDPLTHIIRNSCDHGIEPKGVRAETKKPAQGTLHLSAIQEAGFILITIKDDGGGIDAEKIKDKALKMGVISQDQASSMSDKAALQLIFNAGLSTAEKVTNFSGRGVGMDVVRTEIERVGGSVDIDSTVGKGTSLRIRIPLTLAIISAMVVGCDGQRFAIPQMSVQELLSAPESSEEWRLIAGQPFFRLRGKLLPVLRLKSVLNLNEDEKPSGSIVVADLGDRTFGILVDEIFGAEEIVVKPLGIHFQHLNFYGGCSILGDGAVIPIFDCNGLASMVQLSSETELAQDFNYLGEAEKSEEQQHALIFIQGKQRFVIPMTLVERLECFEAERIEQTASGEVLQYRGEVIKVLRWGDMLGSSSEHDEKTDEVSCLILSDGGKRMCLQVDQVHDIVEVSFEIKQSSDNPLFLGTTVIEDIATEVVDVFEVVQQADPNWFAQPHDMKQTKILFVEDAQFFRHLVIPVLESMNFTIQTANDGVRACELLNHFKPDLILTDIEMPKMNGYDLAKWVKDQPSLLHIPVVALTAKNDVDQELADEVFTEVLSKLDSQSLSSDLERILQQHGVVEEQVQHPRNESIGMG